jgi:hypothetical protein
MARGRRAPAEGRLHATEAALLDLHTHTSRSDGVTEPPDLVAQAAAAGVRLLAITDHDTLAGVRELLAGPGIPAGLELLPGVEINAVAGIDDLPDGELHVLGLGVDPEDDAFEQVLAGQRARREERFGAMVRRLAETGTPVDRELELVDRSSIDALGRPTLARALVRAGFAADVGEAFSCFVGRGRPGYVPREGIGPAAAIRAIRAAGGLAVLAHFAEAPRMLDLVDELREVGLGGLEVYYRAFDVATVAELEQVAFGRGLVPTGGSDYHGDGERYAEAHAELAIPATVAAGVHAAIGAARAGGERGARREMTA